MKNQTRGSLGPTSRRALCIILWLAFAAAAWAVPLTATGSSGSLEATTKVRFQYGASFSETSILATPVPEPVTMAMIGAGLIGLGILRRRAVR